MIADYLDSGKFVILSIEDVSPTYVTFYSSAILYHYLLNYLGTHYSLEFV